MSGVSKTKQKASGPTLTGLKKATISIFSGQPNITILSPLRALLRRFFLFNNYLRMKKVLPVLGAVLAVLVTVPLFAAFESHVINVVATVENALSVSATEIDFGTVFPGQYEEHDFTISLSQSFLDQDRVNRVEYIIKQKPKPRPESYDGDGPFDDHFAAHVFCLNKQGDDPQADNYDADYYTYCYRTLCPYLSKLPKTAESGDVGVPSYYQGDTCSTPSPEHGSGVLSQQPDDASDIWTIDLKVPPIEGSVAQDWPDSCPVLPESGVYGCDIWVEVTTITDETGPYCGDGVINQPEEECDLTAGVTSGFTCTSGCILKQNPTTPFCGDGIMNQTGEQCDGSDGVGPHQFCDTGCILKNTTYCGDGTVQTPNDEAAGGPQDDGFEACDGTDGVTTGFTCTASCGLEAIVPECTDADLDTFAVEGESCGPIDCADSNPDVNPNATEDCHDGIDNDCDGNADINDTDCEIACVEKADVMLVLDRSSSISPDEEQQLKTAAHDFVTSLDPAIDGTHMGQSSFSTFGSLDLHLTGVVTTINGAIDALSIGGFTNLKEGIFWANFELRDANITYERPPIHDFMVIITDGNPNQPTDEATARAQAILQANAAKAAGVTIYVLGVGTTADTATFLRDNIASYPEYYYDVANYADLSASLQTVATCNGGD